MEGIGFRVCRFLGKLQGNFREASGKLREP